MTSGRPLRTAERELLGCFSARIDLDRVRVYGNGLARLVSVFTGGAAIALGYRVFTPRDLALPTLAHELAHVCQYAEWGALRYFATGAWNQIVLRTLLRRDVYRWEVEPGKAFGDYGMEQQGQIVQDSFDVNSPLRAHAQRLSPYQPR